MQARRLHRVLVSTTLALGLALLPGLSLAGDGGIIPPQPKTSADWSYALDTGLYALTLIY